MENKFRVKFNVRVYKNNDWFNVPTLGTVIDRYRDVVKVGQSMPSGKGGEIYLENFKMTTDFYLILADDLSTHKIKCADVIIDLSKGVR